MKNPLILVFSLLFALTTLNAQVLQSRILQVESSNMKSFSERVAKKTKLYNGKKGQAKYFTFQILTGKNAQNFLRFQWAESLDEFDKEDTKGNDYWQKTVG